MVKWITRDVKLIPGLLLSALSIDVDKDWGGRNITNLGVGGHDVNSRLDLVLAHRARHGLGGADEVSLDAGQIASGRFGMARMPDGTSEYVLTAQGIGVDPVYAPAPVPTGNDILEKLQKHLGVWWFNNHWLPAGMLYSSITGSAYITWSEAFVLLNTGTTTGSSVYVRKDARGLSKAYSWAKKRYFGILTYFYTYSAQYLHIVSGAAPADSAVNNYNHIGFKVIDADLYATVGNGTAESTLFIETLTAAVYRRLECVFDPAIPECRFYVDGVDKGALTTNLPTGIPASMIMLYGSAYNTEAANKCLYVFESRTLQVE